MNKTITSPQTRDEVYCEIIDLVKDYTLADEVEGLSLDKLGLDSLDRVELALRIENKMGIDSMVVLPEETAEQIADNAWRLITK